MANSRKVVPVLCFLLSFLFVGTHAERFLLKINLGGGPVADFISEDEALDLGEEYAKMRYHGDIDAKGEPDAEVFKTQRFSRGKDLVLHFPVPDGIYSVTLLFAETWKGAFSNGVRLFDVYLGSKPNGVVRVVPSLDMFGTVGGATAIRRKFRGIAAKDGITLALRPIKQNPQIAGIIFDGHSYQRTFLTDLPTVPGDPASTPPDLSVVNSVGPVIHDQSLVYNPDADPKNRASGGFGPNADGGAPSAPLGFGSAPGPGPTGFGGPGSSGSFGNGFSAPAPSGFGSGPHESNSAPYPGALSGGSATFVAAPGAAQSSFKSEASNPASTYSFGEGTPALQTPGFGAPLVPGSGDFGQPSAQGNSFGAGASLGHGGGRALFSAGSSGSDDSVRASALSSGSFGSRGGFLRSTAGAGGRKGLGSSGGSSVSGTYGSRASSGPIIRRRRLLFTPPPDSFGAGHMGHGLEALNSQISAAQALQNPSYDPTMRTSLRMDAGGLSAAQAPSTGNSGMRSIESSTSRIGETNTLRPVSSVDSTAAISGGDKSMDLMTRGGAPSRGFPSVAHSQIENDNTLSRPTSFDSVRVRQVSNSLEEVPGASSVYDTASRFAHDAPEISAVSRAIAESPTLAHAVPESVAAPHALPEGASALQTVQPSQAAAHTLPESPSGPPGVHESAQTALPAPETPAPAYAATDMSASNSMVQASSTGLETNSVRGTVPGTTPEIPGISEHSLPNGATPLGRAPLQNADSPPHAGGGDGPPEIPGAQGSTQGAVPGEPSGVQGASETETGVQQPPAVGPGVFSPGSPLHGVCIDNETHCTCGMASDPANSDQQCLFIVNETADPKVCQKGKCNGQFVCGCHAEANMLCERKVAKSILTEIGGNSPGDRGLTGLPSIVRCERQQVEEVIHVLEPVMTSG